MNVEYSKRSLDDIREMAARSKREFGDAVSAKLDEHLHSIIDQIARDPKSRTPLRNRAGVHVAVFVLYPYKLFYRIVDDSTVRILHVRHTSRRSWGGE